MSGEQKAKASGNIAGIKIFFEKAPLKNCFFAANAV